MPFDRRATLLSWRAGRGVATVRSPTLLHFERRFVVKTTRVLALALVPALLLLVPAAETQPWMVKPCNGGQGACFIPIADAVSGSFEWPFWPGLEDGDNVLEFIINFPGYPEAKSWKKFMPNGNEETHLENQASPFIWCAFDDFDLGVAAESEWFFGNKLQDLWNIREDLAQIWTDPSFASLSSCSVGSGRLVSTGVVGPVHRQSEANMDGIVTDEHGNHSRVRVKLNTTATLATGEARFVHWDFDSTPAPSQ
jgi:hypothetical protein